MDGWFDFERRWLEVILGAIIPPAAGLPGLADLDLDAFRSRLEEAAPASLVWTLRGATWAFWFGPWLRGTPCTFGGLDRRGRTLLLRRAAHHRTLLVRQMVLTLKVMACLAYAHDRRGRRALGADRTVEVES